MDKEFASKLIPLINSPEFPILLEYVQHRIENNHKRLELTAEEKDLRRLQGALIELRLLEKLRDTIKSLKEQRG